MEKKGRREKYSEERCLKIVGDKVLAASPRKLTPVKCDVVVCTTAMKAGWYRTESLMPVAALKMRSTVCTDLPSLYQLTYRDYKPP